MSGFIVSSDKQSSIRATHVPGGVRIEIKTVGQSTAQITLNGEQAQMLCSQIRNESRKS